MAVHTDEFTWEMWEIDNKEEKRERIRCARDLILKCFFNKQSSCCRRRFCLL